MPQKLAVVAREGSSRGRPHEIVRRAGPTVDPGRRGPRLPAGLAGPMGRVLLGLALLWMVGSSPAAAETPANRRFGSMATLRADRVEVRDAQGIYVARGEVRIERRGRLLVADRVYWSDHTRHGVASGRVVVTDEGETLQADFLHFNIDTLRGAAFDSTYIGPGDSFRLTGSEMRKTGESRYRIVDGRFSTCRCPEPEEREPWSVTSGDADAKVEGHVFAKNNRFEVLGVPVFWAPWFFYPLQRERATGFLTPRVGRSSVRGVEVAAPFFWAPRHNVNLLVTPEYLSFRGFKPSAELEYVFGERSGGALHGTFIHDRSLDPERRPGDDFNRNRWAASWRHRQELPGETHLHVDATGFSDNRFAFDYQGFGGRRLERYLHSRAFLWRHFGTGGLFAGHAAVRFADDLQAPENQDRDRVLLQRLPELRLSALPTAVPGLPGLFAEGDLDYRYFRSRGDPFDEFPRRLLVDNLFFDTGLDGLPNGRELDSQGRGSTADINRDDFATPGGGSRSEGDGRFQEGEPLADRGHRVTLRPRFSYPLHLGGFLHIDPEVGYYGTFYESRARGFEARHLLTTRIDARTRFRGELPWPRRDGGTLHLVEPFVRYASLTKTQQGGLPLLVPRTALPQRRLRHLEIDALLRDPADRIDDVNSLFAGIDNRVLDPMSGDLLAELSLSAEYRFAESAWGPAVLHGRLNWDGAYHALFHAAYDVESTELSEGLFEFNWNSSRGHQLDMNYRYVADFPRVFEDFGFSTERFEDFERNFRRINQLGAGAYLQATDRWALTYRGFYSFEGNLSLSHLAGLEYLSRCKCWAMRLEGSKDRQQGFEFAVHLVLLGLGDTERPFSGERRGIAFGRQR